MLINNRLLLRPVRLDEAEKVASLITEKVSLWTSPIPWPYQVSDAVSWINATTDEERLGIFLLDNLEMIGMTNMPATNGDEVGFWINGRYEGNGYATEAAAAVIHHAFANKKLDFLDSGVHRDNQGSKRVHEKLGFTVITTEDRFWPNKNALVPVFVYRITFDEWSQNKR
jgi:ribosomal-protein-alanine N-acetyltransferase